MSGYRGYRNYRGRGSKGKAALSVVLVLIIIASIVFMVLQKYIIYDETGTPHLALPQKEPTQTLQEDEELKLTIQSRLEEQKLLRLFTVPQAPMSLEDWRLTWTTAEESGNYNGAVILAKTGDGTVCFDAYSVVGGARAIKRDTTTALMEAIQGDTAVEHTVAALTCFRDPYAATHDVEKALGLRRTNGALFQDGDGTAWTDPGKPAMRQYLCSLAGQLAGMGFDEILLTEVTYPITGTLDDVDYGETMKTQNIITFLEEMEQTLAPYDVVLSIQLPEELILEGSDHLAGLMLEDILSRVDRVYAVTTEEQAPELAERLAAKNVDFLPILPTGHRWEGSCMTAAQ